MGWWRSTFGSAKAAVVVPARAAMQPITTDELVEWEGVAQIVYENTLGETDHRWTQLRFRALKVLEQLKAAQAITAGHEAQL